MRYNCYFCYLSAFGLSEGIFSSFFASFIHTTGKHINRGGDMMEDDEYIFELFLEVMKRVEDDDPDGRLRLLSKDPRYAADDPAQRPKKTQLEKR